MDKTERQCHDFMKVDSFSQLPFIRPAPPAKEKGIRLFGIEFHDGARIPTAADESDSTETIATNNALELDANNNTTENGESSSRRFECHYCCRNFPTSQALGGHQNAHKRERQHAKRAHLQSAILSDAQAYGLMNYRFGSAPTTAMAYPTSWNSNNSSSAMIGGGGGRFYGNSYAHHHHHHQRTISGSPLALWRIPTATAATGGGAVQSNPILNRERSLHPLPLFAGEEMMNTRMGASRVGPPVVSPNRYVFDSKPSVNDHVSLDLHL